MVATGLVRCDIAQPDHRYPHRYLEVPPDVTTGLVVVVVGWLVVVVVGGAVVGGGRVVATGLVGTAGAAEDPCTPTPLVGVVVGAAVVDVVVDVAAGTAGSLTACAGTVAEDPGCSRATVTQMRAVAPPLSSRAVRVNRLMRICAAARDDGE